MALSDLRRQNQEGIRAGQARQEVPEKRRQPASRCWRLLERDLESSTRKASGANEVWVEVGVRLRVSSMANPWQDT